MENTSWNTPNDTPTANTVAPDTNMTNHATFKAWMTVNELCDGVDTDLIADLIDDIKRCHACKWADYADEFVYLVTFDGPPRLVWQ